MTVLLAAAALLLLATGAAKLRRPEPARAAFAGAGLPDARWAVQLLAVAEVAAGGAALVWRSPVPDAAVALLYAAFAAYVLTALRPDAAPASCGCSGRDDTPVTPLHLVVDVLLAASAATAAVAHTPALLTSLSTPTALLALVVAALTAEVGWLAITVLPRVTAAQRALR